MSWDPKSRLRAPRGAPSPETSSGKPRQAEPLPTPETKASLAVPPSGDVAHPATDTLPRTTRPSAREQVALWRQEGQPVPVQKVSRMLEDLHQEHGLVRRSKPRPGAIVPHGAIEPHPSAADLKTRRFLSAQKVMDHFWERLEPRLEAKQEELLARADAGQRLSVAALRKETAKLFKAAHQETFARLPPALREEYDEAVRVSLHGFDASSHFQSGQHFALSLCFGFLSHCEAMPAVFARRSGKQLPTAPFQQPFVGEGFRLLQFIASLHFDIAPSPFDLSDDRGHGLGNLQLVELNQALHLAVSAHALPPLESVELVFEAIAKQGIAPRFGCPALSAAATHHENVVAALVDFVQTVAKRHVFTRVETELAAAGRLASP